MAFRIRKKKKKEKMKFEPPVTRINIFEPLNTRENVIQKKKIDEEEK